MLIPRSITSLIQSPRLSTLYRHLQTRIIKPANTTKSSVTFRPILFTLPIPPTTTKSMPPKGSGKRKRAQDVKTEVDISALPTDLTPPPNFVMEQAGRLGSATSTMSTTKPPAGQDLMTTAAGETISVNPDKNPEIVDARSALRASPDADEDQRKGEKVTEEFDVGNVVQGMAAAAKEDAIEPEVERAQEAAVQRKGRAGRGAAKKSPVDGSGPTSKSGSGVKVDDKAYSSPPEDTIQIKRESTPLTTVQPDQEDGEGQPPAKKTKKTPTKASVAAKKGADEIKAFVAAQAKVKKEENTDGEDAAGGMDGDGDGPEGITDDMDAREREAKRPPPVNSDYLPLPWKGRLGYACLNTYLRFSNPPVFASRTCRIASILEHRYPLTNPDEPEHPTKNRPDKTKTASVERGMKYVESIGLANAQDCIKMIRWNAKYGIRFMRLSSEMFPFASHDEYGYGLEGFAKDVLAEVGKVAAEEGCRLTTHPGQVSCDFVQAERVVETHTDLEAPRR